MATMFENQRKFHTKSSNICQYWLSKKQYNAQTGLNVLIHPKKYTKHVRSTGSWMWAGVARYEYGELIT